MVFVMLSSKKMDGSTNGSDSSSGYESLTKNSATSSSNNKKIKLFIESINKPVKAKYDKKDYIVHYLDLSDDEYEKVQSIYYETDKNEIFLEVPRDDIDVTLNLLSLRRHREPENEVNLENNMERIYFSTDGPLTVKFKGKYYLASENLSKMYVDLRKLLKINSGFCVRIKSNLVEPNELDRELGVLVAATRFVINKVNFPTKSQKIQRDEQIKRYLPILLNDIDFQLIFDCQNFPEVILELIDDNDQIEHLNIARNHTQSQDNHSDRLDYDAIMENALSRELFKFFKCKLNASTYKNPIGFEMKRFLHRFSEFKRADKITRLHTDNYYEMFKLMIHLEDLAEYEYIQKFNRNNIKFLKDSYVEEKFVRGIKIRKEISKNIYSIPLDNNTLEWEVAFLENDIESFWFEEMRSHTVNDEFCGYDKVSSNKIVHICEDKGKIYVQLTANRNHRFTEESYSIHFIQHRYPIILQHRALNIMSKHELIPFFYPCEEYKAEFAEMRERFLRKNPPTNEIQIPINRNLNREQIRAVENIIDGSSYPFPYVLYGPPGTGKTKTVVNAIDRIVTTTNDYVLVCAISNAASDVLFSGLLEILPKEQRRRIYRWYSSKVKYENIPDDIKNSNLHNIDEEHGHQIKKLRFLQSRRVVVCTVLLAGKFVTARNLSKHFSYIFIDECGNATETASLVPIMGICTSHKEIHAKITIIGDPKQLGPVTKSQRAANISFDVSLLQRLMGTEFYKFDKTKRGYNEKHVMQLVKNYRNHPEILEFSNRLFYKNALQAKANSNTTNWFIDSNILLAPKYPIIYYSIEGRCQKDGLETSWYNILEYEKVVEYVTKLLKMTIQDEKGCHRKVEAKDIGIVSPYKKQSTKIRELCRAKKIPDLDVGSVEIFQGREKPIIIATTVRSNQKNIGFLRDFRRLNVLLTRAKCLLIIIGNTTTFTQHKNWKSVIKYCNDENALTYHQ